MSCSDFVAVNFINSRRLQCARCVRFTDLLFPVTRLFYLDQNGCCRFLVFKHSVQFRALSIIGNVCLCVCGVLCCDMQVNAIYESCAVCPSAVCYMPEHNTEERSGLRSLSYRMQKIHTYFKDRYFALSLNRQITAVNIFEKT
jgi:hypothetical protein